MSYYASHDFALAALRAMRCGLCSSSLLGSPVPFSPVAPRGRLPIAFDTAGNATLSALSRSGPIDVIVASAADRIQSARLHSHAIGTRLPGDCFRWLSEDLCVAGPELTFVLMSKQLDAAQALALGLELCGTYSKGPGGDGDVTSYDIPAMTSVAAIADFVAATRGMCGAGRARRLLPYLMDGSASPSETALLLLARLPRTRGGYQLDIPIANKRLDVPDEILGLTDKRTYYLDIYLPKFNATLEYESDAFHADDASFERNSKLVEADKRRFRDIQMAGIRVIPVTKTDLASFDDLERFMKATAVTLGDTKDADVAARRMCPKALENLRRDTYEQLVPWHR